jgi:hypothetical protein
MDGRIARHWPLFFEILREEAAGRRRIGQPEGLMRS